MKAFPFVLGTDIVQVTRWDPIHRPQTVLALARRMLHPKEYPNIKKVNITLWEALSSHGLFKQWHVSNRPSRQGRSIPQEKCSVAEAHLFKSRLDTVEGTRVRNFLAGRWAAKEAARKAWGAHLLGFKDVRIAYDLADIADDDGDHKDNARTTSSGVKIVCEPHCGKSKFEADANDDALYQEGRLSISHDGDYVVATVIAEPLAEDLRSIFKGRSGTKLAPSDPAANFNRVVRDEK